MQTLLDEPSFGVATSLLGVLGEGAFLSLLGFLERHAPDDCVSTIAARRRWNAGTTRSGRPPGLNQDVFDALVIVAAELAALRTRIFM